MPKFNAKKHDLTPSEAKFLTELAGLTTKDLKSQVDEATRAVSASRAQVSTAKAKIEKKISAAMSEVKKATKHHSNLKKKFTIMNGMVTLIEKSPPKVANFTALKLDRLNQDLCKCENLLNSCLDRTRAELGDATKTFSMMSTQGSMPGLRIVPSQVKVIILAP